MFDNLVHCYEAVHFELCLWDLNQQAENFSKLSNHILITVHGW